MGPRLRGDDSGESLLHIRLRGNERRARQDLTKKLTLDCAALHPGYDHCKSAGRSSTMDMSVTISPNQDEQASKTTAPPPRAANASDLDAWLEKVEALGELKRITAEVDPDLEAATITYLVGSSKSPALLFENIKGH